MGSALFPQMDSVQLDVLAGIEKRLVLQADSISNHAPDERRRKLIPWSKLIRSLEIAGAGGANEPHPAQVVDLAEMDSWRDLEAILDCGFDHARDESRVLSRKGEMLKFEPPPYMKAVHPRNLVASNSTGTSARVLEFRRHESFNGRHSAGGAL
jgi:hypothetical protein